MAHQKGLASKGLNSQSLNPKTISKNPIYRPLNKRLKSPQNWVKNASRNATGESQHGRGARHGQAVLHCTSRIPLGEARHGRGEGHGPAVFHSVCSSLVSLVTRQGTAVPRPWAGRVSPIFALFWQFCFRVGSGIRIYDLATYTEPITFLSAHLD